MPFDWTSFTGGLFLGALVTLGALVIAMRARGRRDGTPRTAPLDVDRSFPEPSPEPPVVGIALEQRREQYIRVSQHRLFRHGSTPECPACRALGESPVPEEHVRHSERCDRRFEQLHHSGELAPEDWSGDDLPDFGTGLFGAGLHVAGYATGGNRIAPRARGHAAAHSRIGI